ncbi:hypothetical protein PHMEG_00012735, partial [Phytophthora megakarya]
KLLGEWLDEFNVFLKLSKHAPQRDFRELDEENYDSRISRAWDLARLRLHGHSDFVLMHFMYIQARLPVVAPLQVPDNATFRQLQHMNQLSQEV